jgi:hypothetical protein
VEKALSVADMKKLAKLIERAGGIDELLLYLDALAASKERPEEEGGQEPGEQHRSPRRTA